MASRARGAAEAAERAKPLMPVATVIPRIMDRITPPEVDEPCDGLGPAFPVPLPARINQCALVKWVPLGNQIIHMKVRSEMI